MKKDITLFGKLIIIIFSMGVALLLLKIWSKISKKEKKVIGSLLIIFYIISAIIGIIGVIYSSIYPDS